jgi:integrase
VTNKLVTKHPFQSNRCHQFVRAIFNWCVDKGSGPFRTGVENPAKGLKLPFEKKKEKAAARDIYLEPDELERFEAALKDEPCADLRDFLILARYTEARRSNVFAMRWDSIKWERGAWEVPYSKNEEGYTCELQPEALKVLQGRYAERAADAEYVFPGVGRTGHLVNLNRHWNEFRKRANLSRIRLHDIRRTEPSYQAMAGVSLAIIGKGLGHKPGSTQTALYARLAQGAVRDGHRRGREESRKQMKEAAKRRKLHVVKSKSA